MTAKIISLRTLLLAFVLLSVETWAQESSQLFSSCVLNNPIAHSYWFDSNLPIAEKARWESAPADSMVFLKNGYAESVIMNPKEWMTLSDSVTPQSVELVFTKYPYNRNHWITNYYELLSDRIQALLAIDSTLNSPDVEWRLVLQTDCQTADVAENLPHGIAIAYTIPPKPEPPPANHEQDIAAVEGEKEEEDTNEQEPEDTIDPSFPGPEILYPESIHRRPERNKPRRNRERYGPPCPNLPTQR